MAARTCRTILLLGSAGSGKGTQAQLLQSRLGIHHLDFGNARRTAVEKKTPAGLRIAALGDLVSGGKFIDDDLVTEVFLEALHAQQATCPASIVLDGFPRNCEQLGRLRRELGLDLALVLHAPFETLLRRIDGRLIHKPSGRTYHPTERPPMVPMQDDVTGEPLHPRLLSTELSPAEALRARCAVEAKEIGPLVQQLEEEGLVEHVDAVGDSAEVHAKLVQVLISKGLHYLSEADTGGRGASTHIVLPQELLEEYKQKGWVAVEGVLDAGWVAKLRGAVEELIESSKSSTQSTDAFDIESGHSSKNPMLRKIKRPHLWHPCFAAVSMDPRVLSVVEQLLGTGGGETQQQQQQQQHPHQHPHPQQQQQGGGGVRWQGDKIVIKMPHVGQQVVCHQDWAFYPHTNDDLCTVSVVLEDMTLERGGLCYVPGSHRGPVYAHHDESGSFVGGITDPAFNPGQVSWDAVECAAGSLVIHHARTVHASPPNTSPTIRPLLLIQYAAKDA